MIKVILLSMLGIVVTASLRKTYTSGVIILGLLCSFISIVSSSYLGVTI